MDNYWLINKKWFLMLGDEMTDKIQIKDSYYLINGKKYIRVTKVLDVIAQPEFYWWYAKNGYKKCEKIKKDRAAFGSSMHMHFQHWLDDGEVLFEDLSNEMRLSITLFALWIKEHHLEPKHLEYHVKHDVYKYAGTIDFVGLCDEQLMILDWKSSKKVYDNFYLQIAAYVVAYEYQTGEKIKKAGILCIRDGVVKYEVISRKKLDDLFVVFLSALNIYRWKRGKT